MENNKKKILDEINNLYGDTSLSDSELELIEKVSENDEFTNEAIELMKTQRSKYNDIVPTKENETDDILMIFSDVKNRMGKNSVTKTDYNMDKILEVTNRYFEGNKDANLTDLQINRPNMKTRSIQTLLLAATLGLLVTACNNDSDQTVDITKPINVKLSLTITGTNIPISRAAIGATEFDDDDALGLYIAHKTGANGESPITSSLDPKNAPWVNGSFTDEPLYWQNVTDQHTLYAYYPYTNTATDTYTVPNVSIKPDQNNSSTAAADYEASDLLWGKCTTVATNNASISMKHCMSQITVTLSAGTGYSSLPAIDKVELLCSAGFALSGTWNLEDGKVTKANDAAATDAATASTTSITTYAHSVAGATTYRAIVLPGQAFTNSSQFVKVTSGSNTYTYYLAMSSSENLTTEANKTYNFDLRLNKAGLTLKGITIAAWDTDEIEGDAGMDIGN